MKKILLYGLAVLLLLTWTLPALASPLTDAQAELEKIQSKIDGLNKQKQTATKQRTQLTEKDKALQKELAEEDKKYRELEKQVETLIAELENLEKAVGEAEEKYSHQEDLFKNRLRVMYENASTNSYFEALLESDSISEFFSKLEIMSLVSRSDKQLIKELEAAKKDVEYKREWKEIETREKQNQIDSTKEELELIETSRAGVKSDLKSLESTLKKIEAQEDALLEQSKKQESVIKSLLSKGTNYTGGIMVWPLPSSTRVTSQFGTRLHPILKTYKTHTGTDIAGNTGADIVAANDGTVIQSGWNDAYGYRITIDHGGGISTMYAHCSKLLVSVGNKVKAGDVIGKVGSTGLATGPHLHFEVQKEGKPVDPMDYISPN